MTDRDGVVVTDDGDSSSGIIVGMVVSVLVQIGISIFLLGGRGGGTTNPDTEVRSLP